MNENSDLLPNLLHEEFEMQMRGYSRRQVDEFVARRNNEIRDLEQRLSRALDETEQTRRELSGVRQQALAGRPAHEEVSERISQILKLADDEAKAQKGKADDDIAKLRADAQQETDRVRADAREQAERMLTAAQEQAERTIAAARTEADKMRTTARTESDRLTTETRKKADQVMADSKSQAKKVLDEANARATAIHDGAERRLNLLSTRHAETVRRLTDILDGVQGLVTAEASRMSLEEEVNESVAGSLSASAAEQADENGDNSGNTDERDLAALAPPAPETIASGAVVPPMQGRPSPNGPGLPAANIDEGMPMPAGRPEGGPASPFDLPDAVFPGPLSGRQASGDDGPGPALPPPPPMPRRLRTPPPPEGVLGGDPMPLPNGAPRSGPAIPLGPGLPDGDRDDSAPDPDNGVLGRVRDVLVEYDSPQGNSTGLIDPDEPTEGIRLMR